MILEKLPALQSLTPEEKWTLIDELWNALAQEMENSPANAETVALLEERFAQYIANPSATAGSVEEVFARLVERKRSWS